MKTGQIVASVDPRNGGPSVSVPRLCRALADRRIEVSLLSTHSTPREPATHSHLTTQVFRQEWPARLSRSPDLASHLMNRRYDVLHSHGLWLRPLHYATKAARHQGIPHVISPRGMMSPWAWNFHRWKKALADRLVHPHALHTAAGYHATSKAEADDIRALGFKQPICIAPNGIDRPDSLSEEQARRYWQMACPEAFERPTALFYSRFHRKKRVLELIDLWAAEARQDWILLMVGFPQEYSVEELREYAFRAGGANSIVIFDGTDAPPPYPAASLFLLPSLSENFGMVVAEALAYGLPVIVTDSTPWECINSTDYGWCGPWDQFRSALHQSLALGPKTLREQGAKARDWAVNEFAWDRTAALMSDFYASLKV